MILGRAWVEAVAELALSKATQYQVHPLYFYCLRPETLEPEDGEFISPTVHWRDQAVVMNPEPGVIIRYWVWDELRRRSPILLEWAQIYALARELLDNNPSEREALVFSLELEKKLAALDRYRVDGSKGGRRVNNALLQYLSGAVAEITEEWGQCTFTTLCAWLEENADGAETGFADCDEVEHITEDEKPYLTWVDSRGDSHRVALSSLKNTYFKKIRTTLG